VNLESTVPILGIGDDGLDGMPPSTRQRIERADLLIGDQRTLDLVPEGTQQRMVIGTDLDEAVERIAANSEQQIVVLAYGDPLFYGLARYLCDRLGKERFRVQPHVSSMQLAFSRVMETWDDAYLSDLANHGLDQVVERIRVADKVGLFTTDDRTPAHLARALLDRGIEYFLAYVCENLGSPDERVTQGTLAEIASQTFSPLNVMILIRDAGVPDRPPKSTPFRLFGNPEEAFLQSKPKRGLLTPAEVRAMGLGELSLRSDSIVWDVGAGCGSVSIEAARIAAAGTAYAIEKDAEDYHLIRENMKRFGVTNVVPVLGRAPEAWADLPDPDAVFVEGSGREVSRIVDLAYARLREGGRLVANVGSIENLSDVHRTMSRRTEFVKTWMVNLARGTYQLERLRFDALNPTFLLSMSKTSSAPSFE